MQKLQRFNKMKLYEQCNMKVTGSHVCQYHRNGVRYWHNYNSHWTTDG